MTLTAGENLFTFAVHDAAGNVTDGVIRFYRDGGVGPTSLTVTTQDGDPDRPPVAAEDRFGDGGSRLLSTRSFVPRTPADGLLRNDSDPDGDPLTAVPLATTSALGATVTVRADGTFEYDPTAALRGLSAYQQVTDSFSYTVSDGRGGQGTWRVSLDLINDPTALALGTIGDQVWSDRNRNGLQDPGEAGLSGITVELRDEAGRSTRR